VPVDDVAPRTQPLHRQRDTAHRLGHQGGAQSLSVAQLLQYNHLTHPHLRKHHVRSITLCYSRHEISSSFAYAAVDMMGLFTKGRPRGPSSADDKVPEDTNPDDTSILFVPSTPSLVPLLRRCSLNRFLLSAETRMKAR
jgi:hypothetical protein